MSRSTQLVSRWTPLCVALLGCAWAACSGKNTVSFAVEPAGAGGTTVSVGRAGSANGGAAADLGASSGAPTSATAGANASATAGANASATAGATAGANAVDSAGSAGDDGAVGANGGSGVINCVADADCGTVGSCAAVFCRAGSCQTSIFVRGTHLVPDVPADCRATQCDGHAEPEQVLDFDNAPASSNPCLVAACNDVGNSMSRPSAAGVACESAQGGRVCDGAGQCVACLTSADCDEGTCVAHRCSLASCSNGQQDGAETDVDCGGTCPVCADKKQCKIDQDCASDDCDALWHVCLPASCIDQKRDGSETDVDCGGADCAGCFTYLKCRVNADCATQQCDPATLQCAGNACTDHRQDGVESDIDCGGANDCVGCKVGQKCTSNFDCDPGLLCDAQLTPNTCQHL